MTPSDEAADCDGVPTEATAQFFVRAGWMVVLLVICPFIGCDPRVHVVLPDFPEFGLPNRLEWPPDSHHTTFSNMSNRQLSE